MPSAFAKRLVSPIIELGGVQWLVHEWSELEVDEPVTVLRLYRLTPDEQRLAAKINTDHETWFTLRQAMRERVELPPIRDFDIDAALAADDARKKRR